MDTVHVLYVTYCLSIIIITHTHTLSLSLSLSLSQRFVDFVGTGLELMKEVDVHIVER